MALDWQEAYSRNLVRPFLLGGSFELVVSRIWEYGILAHIAPQDPEVFKKRKEKRRPVWRRDDPALYWRILYAARYAVYEHERNLSFEEAIVTWPVMLACMKHPGHMAPNQASLHRETNQASLHRETNQAFLRGVGAVSYLAAEEIQKHGQMPHEIPFGALGTYKGLHVGVERCDPYGRIVLGLNDDAYHGEERLKAWIRLVKETHLTCVEPSDLNPAVFTAKYGEPLQKPQGTATAHS